MLLKLKVMCNSALKSGFMFDVLKDKKYEDQRLFGELLRNVHSIEKGLSLHKIRSGFGYEKITEAFGYALKLLEYNDTRYNEAIHMFINALTMYLEYHKEIGYKDDKIKTITNYYNTLIDKTSFDTAFEPYGGYQTIVKTHYSDDDYKVIESLFYNRHSVREFSREPVDNKKLYSAIELAHHCPSACNRQGYRVHIVSKEKFNVFNKWFEGVGGFAEELDKILLITGELSMYRYGETMQYIVSSSVYAAYLTLTLQAQGIGCCFIQRPVLITDEWRRVRNELNIPGDEQIVCALGIGNLLEEYKTPISHRISLDTIVTEH